jgi:alanyl-tRNA synthetase
MTSAQIRQSFLDFFREKQHAIVPSGSLLPDSPNLLFTNAGMNQFVPIFLGQQKPSWDPPRVVDTQKCIRAGGKHNDLDDVGLDTYHHTFFEMLGNWSFGDYFKKEAIDWAWELVIERWKLPAERLYATVYKPGPGEPSEFDQEAHDHWKRLFEKAGLDPAAHIVNGNKKDNFWMMGDTGPCGPCSELHIDLTPAGDTKGSLVNAGDPRCIEIWNLVFIQFNADADGSFTPLPQRHVDTGMGFERVTAMIQGTKGFTDFSRPISNYETDVFRSIFDEIEKLSGKKYGSTLPIVGQAPRLPGAEEGSRSGRPTTDPEQEKIDIAFRVIADHIRTLSFAIGDGIQPSNEGRGYVLRRILRRAIRYGRALGFHEPFFFKLVDTVANTMGDVFPEVRERQMTIQEAIRREERAFNETVDRGIGLLNAIMFLTIRELANDGSIGNQITQLDVRFRSSDLVYSSDQVNNKGEPATPRTLEVFLEDNNGPIFDEFFGRRPVVDGKTAFELFDTYGFPLDLTELLTRERGLTVDVAGFEKLMDEQRARARKAQKKETIEIKNVHSFWGPTQFVGFESLESVGGKYILEEDRLFVEVTPFYAEMGGQVGDTGFIETARKARIDVLNTLRSPGGVHMLRLAEPNLLDGDDLPWRQVVDAPRRRSIERHHTVTHLLHWALHEIVSREAVQKGSYVGPEKLTFDFSSAALTPEQKREVGKLVNEKIGENAPVSWTEIPYAEVKKRSDIQQFFGDKYGDTVRVVQIGGEPERLNGYSMELCGGTHVRATGDIGSFRIVREEAIAAGIRRIEAVAGDAARDWAKQEATRQQEKFETLARKKTEIGALPEFAEGGETSAMLAQIDARSEHLAKLEIEVHEWEKQQAKASEGELRTRAEEIAKELTAANASDKAVVAKLPDADAKLLQAVVDALKPKFHGPIVLAGENDGRVALIASVPKDLASQFQANKLIQEIAPIVGGKGGGRPDNAQGAGKDVAKIGEALARARELLL